MNLRTECLKHVPLTAATVESIWSELRKYSEGELLERLRALCLSHERLRAELEGCEATLAKVETP